MTINSICLYAGWKKRLHIGRRNSIVFAEVHEGTPPQSLNDRFVQTLNQTAVFVFCGCTMFDRTVWPSPLTSPCVTAPAASRKELPVQNN